MPRNNKAKHYISHEKYLCNYKAKVIKEKSTRIKAKVTCERCLKGLKLREKK